MKLRNKKTGKIIEYSLGLNEWSEDNQEWFLFWNYDSIDELKEEWEDYKPKEPLIKDEKIRKSVRAWAEALDLRWFRRCSSINSYTSRLLGCNAEGVCYTMELKPQDLYDERITKDSYTITELCGEEDK